MHGELHLYLGEVGNLNWIFLLVLLNIHMGFFPGLWELCFLKGIFSPLSANGSLKRDFKRVFEGFICLQNMNSAADNTFCPSWNGLRNPGFMFP